ncbi:MAG: ferredoxin--NADP reductase [Candidatus Zhuqueibacterota bacterium]
MEEVKPPFSGTPSDTAFSTKITRRRWLSESTFELTLSSPNHFTFEPGQRIRLIHNSMERDYSLTSAPSEPVLTVCIRKVEGGLFSTALSQLSEGTSLEFTGPHGYFTFKPSAQVPVFIATGTGIAPFVSMRRSLRIRPIMLHGARAVSGLFFSEVFRAVSGQYIPCLTAPVDAHGQLIGAFLGRVTDYLRSQLPRENYDFYLCGNSEMIRDAIFIIDQHFSGSLVYTEIYY